MLSELALTWLTSSASASHISTCQLLIETVASQSSAQSQEKKVAFDGCMDSTYMGLCEGCETLFKSINDRIELIAALLHMIDGNEW